MRATFSILPILLLCAARSFGADTALRALTLLPPEEVGRLVKIVGSEGLPDPERWHFIVYEPAAERGFREYVISEQKVVARREVSQFVQEVRANDVLGGEIPNVDSDAAARTALDYVAVTGRGVRAINYSLQKDPASERAVWTVTCMDPGGQTVGSWTLAANGPAPAVAAAEPEVKTSPKPEPRKAIAATRTKKERLPVVVEPAPEDVPVPEPVPVRTPVRDEDDEDDEEEENDQDERKATVRRAKPVERERKARPSIFRRATEPIRRITRILPF